MAMMGERIEEGVGGGVVGLSWGAGDTGERGEQDEGVEVAVLGELVEEPGGVELGREHASDALGRHGGEQAVVDTARSVDDGAERMGIRDGVEERLECLAVG